MNEELRIVVSAKDNASNTIKRVQSQFGEGAEGIGHHLERAADRTQRAMVQITKAMALAGIAAAGGALKIGFDFNNSLEQAQTKLMAFTKDGAKVAETLEWVKKEAAATQFSFSDMATAAAELTPVSKSSGRSLEELIKQAEVLAALNPAQGLSGAVFSLREALTGDFVSIVERFNLPRKRLNELKEEGVPAIDAIRIALQEMGIDFSLVEAQGKTTAARWDQLKDKFSIFAGELSKPLFDKFSSGIDSASKKFDEMKPRIQALMKEIADKLGPKLQELWIVFTRDLVPALSDFVSTISGKDGIIESIGWFIDKLAGLMTFISNNTWIITALVGAFVAVKTAMFLSGAIQAFTTVMTAATAAATTAGGAIAAVWGGVTTLLATPIVLPALIVGAAIASLAWLYNEAENTRKAVEGAIKAHEKAADIAPIIAQTNAMGGQSTKGLTIVGGAGLTQTNFQPPRATGGRVQSGQAYTVGERQAETFVPNTSGRIMPSTRDSGGAGGSVVNNIYGNIEIANEQAAVAFFDRLDKTQRLSRMGMS